MAYVKLSIIPLRTEPLPHGNLQIKLQVTLDMVKVMQFSAEYIHIRLKALCPLSFLGKPNSLWTNTAVIAWKLDTM